MGTRGGLAGVVVDFGVYSYRILQGRARDDRAEILSVDYRLEPVADFVCFFGIRPYVIASRRRDLGQPRAGVPNHSAFDSHGALVRTAKKSREGRTCSFQPGY